MIKSTSEQFEIRKLVGYIRLVAKSLELKPIKVIILVLKELGIDHNGLEVDPKVQKLREEVLEALSRLQQMDIEG